MIRCSHKKFEQKPYIFFKIWDTLKEDMYLNSIHTSDGYLDIEKWLHPDQIGCIVPGGKVRIRWGIVSKLYLFHGLLYEMFT